MTTTADSLAKRLADLERRLRGVEVGSQLSNSSFEDPDGNTVNAVEGILQGVAASGDASDALAAAATAQGVADSAHVLATTIGPTQITDDAIQTRHLATGAVTADAISANSIQAGMIAAAAIQVGNFAAGAIKAGDIDAGAITADKLDANAINGKTITGATIQTATSGQRWVMENGIGESILAFTGQVVETAAAYIYVGSQVAPTYDTSGVRHSGAIVNRGPHIDLGAPNWGDGQAHLAVVSKQGSNAAQVRTNADVFLEHVSAWVPAVVSAAASQGVLFDFNAVTGTPDASGFLTVAHRLGKVPTVVLCQAMAPSGGSPIIMSFVQDTRTSTTFRVRAINTTGGAFTGASLTLGYLAIA